MLIMLRDPSIFASAAPSNGRGRKSLDYLIVVLIVVSTPRQAVAMKVTLT